MKSDLAVVALVGYTNAGKSSLMNGMLASVHDAAEKQVFEKDMLFATLDTTVRKIEVPHQKGFLLTDTVGFIDKLPHQLVKAFYSTLEEVKNADLLVHVVDVSDVDYKEHMRVTLDTLHELEAEHIPRITVFNKADLADKDSTVGQAAAQPFSDEGERRVCMSAKKSQDVEALIQYINRCAYHEDKECELLIPFDKGNVYSYLKQNAAVLAEEYRPEGIWIKAALSPQDAGKYVTYIVG
jgi:GTP-binding protein HflX